MDLYKLLGLVYSARETLQTFSSAVNSIKVSKDITPALYEELLCNSLLTDEQSLQNVKLEAIPMAPGATGSLS
jgi:hypothetical protein